MNNNIHLRLSQEEYIARCIKTHGNTYGLENTTYVNSKTKVSAFCKIHGTFLSYPSDFAAGRGCRKCGFIKQQETKISKGIVSKDKSKFVSYRNLVRQLSNQNYIKYYYDINPENLRRGKEFHLDHIISIYVGYVSGLSVQEISHPKNLRIVPAKENISKGIKYSISASSKFDEENIKTKELTQEILDLKRLSISNSYTVENLLSGEIEIVRCLTDWCKDNSFSISSARWACNYGKSPFKGIFKITKL